MAVGGGCVLLVGLNDCIKASAVEAVRVLRGMGLDCYMVTGDNETTARLVARYGRRRRRHRGFFFFFFFFFCFSLVMLALRPMAIMYIRKSFLEIRPQRLGF
jgi:hypothetical protein